MKLHRHNYTNEWLLCKEKAVSFDTAVLNSLGARPGEVRPPQRLGRG